jgi:CRISPR-associated protein Cas2
MYVIAVYDVGQERVAKVLKLFRQYLHWIQNSVFEGEITETKLAELITKLHKNLDLDYDSVIIFKSRDERWLEKEIIGVEKNATDNFL